MKYCRFISAEGPAYGIIAAVFEAEGKAEKALEKILDANGLDESDDGSLILRREIASGGKGGIFRRGLARQGSSSKLSAAPAMVPVES